jgi:hypothetical protein
MCSPSVSFSSLELSVSKDLWEYRSGVHALHSLQPWTQKPNVLGLGPLQSEQLIDIPCSPHETTMQGRGIGIACCPDAEVRWEVD